MVFERELNDLRLRKAVLEVECRLRRSLLALEYAQIRRRFDFVGRGTALLHVCRPYLPVLAPIVGFVLVRRWRVIARWGGRALVWKLIRGVVRQVR